MRNVCVIGIVAAVCLISTATAGAAETFSNSVTFIGDSVTAGFGYCGTENLAKVDDCQPNEEMEDSWDLGISLKKCAPPATPPLTDACSNDNFNGEPWKGPAWTPGPNAPRIAYPFQLAAGQSPVAPATVSDWAVTGSAPADWDPKGGEFGGVLGKITGQYAVMTLGANPLLSAFTDIKLLGVSVEEGPCVSSTGYQPRIFGKWYAGPITNPLNCLVREWNRLEQSRHLVSVYTNLLAQGNRVLVLGYYRGCSWSFGNWQVEGSVVEGPSDGNKCKDETREESPEDSNKISQWDQAVAVSTVLNKMVAAAVAKAREDAKKRWPNTGRAHNIAFTMPDPVAWEAHQPKSPQGSWIFLNDTWIHPSQAGHTNLASTVAKAMCSAWGHWCGTPIRW